MEAFLRIRNHFADVNYSNRTGFEYDTKGLISIYDSLYIEDLFIPFKDELNSNLLSLSNEKQIDYLKIILNDSPEYLRNAGFVKEKQYVIEYIKDPENKINNGILKDYIILTYDLWRHVLSTINDCCKSNNIECIKDYDSDGILQIQFSIDNVDRLDGNANNIPENPHPLIFLNGYAYQMFLELKELTVKEKTVVADYSFIFHKMKDKTIKAINSVVTEPAFIEFLNENFHTDISVTKLPYRNPDTKQPLYTATLDKYKADILKQA